MVPVEFLSGFNSVSAALLARTRRIHRLFILENEVVSSKAERETARKREEVVELANKNKIPVKKITREDASNLAETRTHQGILLEVDPFPLKSISSLGSVHVNDRSSEYVCSGLTHDETYTRLGPRPPLWLALDQVVDPQNLGAILRSAYFFGVDGVALCNRNSAPCSPAASRASAGALEIMRMYAADSLISFLEMSNSNAWTVVGSGIDDRVAVPSHKYSFSTPTILVLGNEGHGVRKNIEKVCTTLLHITPGCNPISPFVVDSLNVSVATAVLLSHWAHQTD